MKVPTTLPEIPDLITTKRAEIAALCREYGVAKLEVFGSVMTDEFDPETSDIDFIVTYHPIKGLNAWVECFFGLERRLAELFERDVDLIEADARGFRNPYFARFSQMTRRVIVDVHQDDVRSPAPSDTSPWAVDRRDDPRDGL